MFVFPLAVHGHLGCSSLLHQNRTLPRDVVTQPGRPHGSSCQQSHGEGTWPVGDVFGAVPLPPADSGPVLLALLLRDAAAGVAQGEGMLPKCARQGGGRERRGKNRGKNVLTAWLGAQSPRLCLPREDSGLSMSREALGGFGVAEPPLPIAPAGCWGELSSRGSAPSPEAQPVPSCLVLADKGLRKARGSRRGWNRTQLTGQRDRGVLTDRQTAACRGLAGRRRRPELSRSSAASPAGQGSPAQSLRAENQGNGPKTRGGGSLCPPGLSSGEVAVWP